MESGQKQVATILDRVNQGHGAAAGAGASTYGLASGSSDGTAESGWWLAGYGSWGDIEATNNTHQMDTTTSGLMMGADAGIENWRLGAVAGYSQASVTQGTLLSSGDMSTRTAGVYGSGTIGGFALTAGALYNWHEVETNRTVQLPGSTQALKADYEAHSAQVFGELGFGIELGTQVLTPFAGVSHISLDSDGFSETGGSAALTAGDNSQSTSFTTLGLRLASQIGDTVHAQGMIGWRHGFGDTDPTSSLTLAGARPGSSAFDVTGAPVADNAFVGEVGVAINISSSATLGASYTGQFGGGTSDHGIKGSFKLRF